MVSDPEVRFKGPDDDGDQGRLGEIHRVQNPGGEGRQIRVG